MLDNGQPVVTAEDFAFDEFGAGSGRSHALLLENLVFESTDLSLFEFLGAEFFCVFRRDTADDINDLPTAFQRNLR